MSFPKFQIKNASPAKVAKVAKVAPSAPTSFPEISNFSRFSNAAVLEQKHGDVVHWRGLTPKQLATLWARVKAGEPIQIYSDTLGEAIWWVRDDEITSALQRCLSVGRLGMGRARPIECILNHPVR